MVALATIYSFGVAIIVPAVTMTAWAIRHRHGNTPGRLVVNRGKRCPGTVREPVLRGRPIVIGDIPREPPGFQPRRELLAALDAHGAGGRVSVVHAVTGMRGVGKTHLAAAYARTGLAGGWRLVAWVNAEDISAVRRGLGAVASALGLNAVNAHGMDAGKAVRRWLEADGSNCLLVFDNAADLKALQPFIPAAGIAHIVITSTLISSRYLGQSVPVDVFTEEEALAFLEEQTGLTDVVGARSVAAELGRLPLALSQAAAVITAQRLDYATYIQRLHETTIDKLLHPVEADQYPRGLAEAVLLSLDDVGVRDRTGISAAVMDLISVLSAAGTPRATLNAAGELGMLTSRENHRKCPPEEVDQALALLSGASLLTFSLDGNSVITHRLVMRTIRERLVREQRLPELCTAASRILDRQAASLKAAYPNADRSAMRDLLEQITAIRLSSAPCINDANVELRRLSLGLGGWALYLFKQLAENVKQASELGESLLPELEQILGPDHPETLACRNDLAISYWRAGRLCEAIELHKSTLARRERVLGHDHPDTLGSRNNLGVACCSAGLLTEAIGLHERTVADRRRLLGPDHVRTLESQTALANAYQDAGRLTEAIELHERTVADRRRFLGPDHLGTLDSQDGLAVAYQDAGRLTEAIELHEHILAGRRRLLGPDHPEVLDSRSKLAVAYQKAGRTRASIRQYRELLPDCERVLGNEHPLTEAVHQNFEQANRKTPLTLLRIRLHSRAAALKRSPAAGLLVT
jgi:tetratricopeptide (TPR) repeat protein